MSTNRDPNAEWTPPEVSYAALERLPRALRDAVNYAVTPWQTPIVLNLYEQARRDKGDVFALKWMMDSIFMADEGNIVEFAAKFKRQNGLPLPHIEADVDALRGISEPRGRRPIYRLEPLGSQSARRGHRPSRRTIR